MIQKVPARGLLRSYVFLTLGDSAVYNMDSKQIAVLNRNL